MIKYVSIIIFSELSESGLNTAPAAIRVNETFLKYLNGTIYNPGQAHPVRVN